MASLLLSSITAYLPQHEGLLPQYLLLVSLVSVGNSIQTYLTTSYAAEVYLGPRPSGGPAIAWKMSDSPVTPLSARTFGTWTLIQSLVRLYAAYHVSNPQLYQLAFWTYAVAWLHFMSEWWIFGTARWGRGLAGPICISTGSVVWIWMQWGYYVDL